MQRHFAHLHWYDTREQRRSTFCSYNPAEATQKAYKAAKAWGASTKRPWAFRIEHETEKVDY